MGKEIETTLGSTSMDIKTEGLDELKYKLNDIEIKINELEEMLEGLIQHQVKIKVTANI